MGVGVGATAGVLQAQRKIKHSNTSCDSLNWFTVFVRPLGVEDVRRGERLVQPHVRHALVVKGS